VAPDAGHDLALPFDSPRGAHLDGTLNGDCGFFYRRLIQTLHILLRHTCSRAMSV